MKRNDPAVSVLKFLQEEKKHYDELLQLVKEQVAVIEKEDETRLQAIVEEKDGLLKATRGNESAIEQVITGLSEEALTNVEQAAGDLRKEVEGVLQQIIELENFCQVELKARKFLAQDKILDLKERKTLLKGYKTSQRIKPKISKNV
ncbi:MAG: hypothetical protein NPINA01_01280 [Nitrospinaceae bacterium]|nr:MAG: hypothetical protein NPINA01_01280 [Nitrospinaceae bacterium]